MNKKGVDRAKQKLERATIALKEMKNLPPSVTDFEQIWYDFLSNFNNAFSQLEQASKVSETGKNWYKEVKRLRKDDPILRYLHHARNAEEHSNISSVHRSGLVLKPTSKNVRVKYRDDYGKKLENVQVQIVQNAGIANLKIIPPRVRARTVTDRGVAYEFPKKYCSSFLDQLIKSGQVVLDEDGLLPFTSVLEIAIGIAYHHIKEAELLDG